MLTIKRLVKQYEDKWHDIACDCFVTCKFFWFFRKSTMVPSEDKKKPYDRKKIALYHRCYGIVCCGCCHNIEHVNK